MNHCVLYGNLTRDVEMRFTPSGTAVGAFGIALNERWTDSNGDKKEKVVFVDVTAFGKQAELLGQYFKKGIPLLMTGKLALDVWDDKKTGEKRSKLKVVLDSFEFTGSKVDSDRTTQPSRQSRPQQGQPQDVGAEKRTNMPKYNSPQDDDSDSVPY